MANDVALFIDGFTMVGFANENIGKSISAISAKLILRIIYVFF